MAAKTKGSALSQSRESKGDRLVSTVFCEVSCPKSEKNGKCFNELRTTSHGEPNKLLVIYSRPDYKLHLRARQTRVWSVSMEEAGNSEERETRSPQLLIKLLQPIRSK